MKHTDFARTITKYFSDYLPGQRNMSSNTIRSYRDALKQLLMFLQETHQLRPERVSFSDLTAEHIRDYLVWLETHRNVSINTRNQRLAAIHSFYRYAQTEYPDIMFESQRILGIPFKRHKREVVGYLTQSCLSHLLNEPDISTQKGRRDLTLITTLYDTGARVQELIDLRVCDVRLAEPTTIKLTGKGEKTRYVPLMNRTCSLLLSYMGENHLLDNGRQQSPLFYNSRYESFTRPGITYILRKYFSRAKERHPEEPFPDTVFPHLLRHTKAVHLLQAGVPLIYIRDYLGHVSITTTEIYLRADTELKRAALEKVYPDIVTNEIPMWTENTELLRWLEDLCS
ncbi:MAG: tyrosine-type recombinase/integrase [Limnochordia bacterium]|nr:tyrosine-type recombinase/integrase [Limnochordia bacterium]